MNIKINFLLPGCILAQDVFKLSNSPLIKKKTVITPHHIEILKLFLVKDVHVEPKLVNGKTFMPKDIINEKNNVQKPLVKKRENKTFIDLYLKAVQQYKKLFTNWQGGTKVEAFSVRKIFLPLFETEPSKEELMQLHHYSTKNDYIYYHSVAVSILSYMIGKRTGLENAEVIQLGLAGLLSDAGMSKLSFNVFDQQSQLTSTQYEEVKKHPIFGYRMLEDVPGFRKEALLGILQHHEREDGTGYPIQVNSKKLHLYAKIIAIADVYHAMTSERYYRKKQSPYKVIASLKIDQFGRLDHNLIETFTHMMIDLSIGSKVRLNNNQIGEVIFQQVKYPTRPIIKLDDDSHIDLTKHVDIVIEEELI
ncbi:phosphohydrolase [Salipaludibacillus neizhouensis]|uniref:Phosphohydrolase n=1 Tax=Salipaludibacillus neizhouensis TaxID=885475 RepID=A0A3A9KMP4_9BACI|nr:HD-GYP domain-containing protein [Salipaludibacillus neizhouensis]RKL66006.1 phosphohydrolase [Salipaludibacillus neizhouensis]